MDYVVVKIVGGLGNQMFQYAAGKSLATSLNARLVLDASEFRKYKLHQYLLPKLNIHAMDVSELAPNWFPSRLREFIGKRRVRKFTVVHEKGQDFDAVFFKNCGSVYLKGYWQTEKYFEPIASLIKDEFQVRAAPSAANRQMLEQIKGTEAISLHVRRGDYFSNPAAKAVHGVLNLNYYDEALNLVTANVVSPHVFIFSDDQKWVRENVKIKWPHTFVTSNSGANAYEDLRLMAECRHHIIANSTFSWWGAWLGAKPGQIVVAPKRWFVTSELSVTDLIPARWVRL